MLQSIQKLENVPEQLFLDKVDAMSVNFEDTSHSISFLSLLTQFNQLKMDIRAKCGIFQVQLPAPNELVPSYDDSSESEGELDM